MKKDFWNSWTKDYLHQLQQRYKWKTNQDELAVGTIVLVKDDKISPSRWPLAKIKEIHPGNDNLTRVVTLQKSSGMEQKRSVHKLIPLPVKISETNDESRGNTIQSNSATITKRQNRCNKVSRWFIIMLTFIQILHFTTAAYVVKKMQPGFYVEQIGTAYVDRGVFRIQTSFEKYRLIQDFEKMKNVTSRFANLCKNAGTIIDPTHCEQLHHHLLEQESKFERTKEYLTEISNTRKRRGLLGQLLTSVFGVNDEVYRDINSLNLNQQKLIESANHQTKFMISTISQVNKTEERIRLKLEGFQNKLNQVIEYIDSNDRWYTKVDHNSINIHILRTYQLAINIMEEIKEIYNGLLEIYLSNSTVYSILTPKNISELIAVANKKLPSNLKIVYQHLLDTKIAQNDTHIQVYAYFPIQDISKYTLMYITAIPKKNADKTFQNIEVNKAYIGLNYNNELYFELSDEELKACIKRSESFICFPGAVKNMQLSENCMVNQLFKNQTKTKCRARTCHISNNAIWKQLYMQNTWLFIVRDYITTSIVCDGQREELELRGIGVLHISDNCIIKTPNNILTAKRTISVEFVTSYSKPLDFSISTYVVSNSKWNITKEEVIDSSKDIFQHLVDKENTLQTELDNTVWQQISSHTYVASFVSSIILFCIILVIICYGPQMIQWSRNAVQHYTRSSGEVNNPDKPSVVAGERPTQGVSDQQGRQRHPICSIEPIYNKPNHQPKQQKRKTREDVSPKSHTAPNESIELYQLESVPEWCQNVHK
uniref:DUF5641 domain-containing protein n=1 Tax=Heliothis virescens TaxID=7102 RepID=A0A2A4KAG8_HELVI